MNSPTPKEKEDLRYNYIILNVLFHATCCGPIDNSKRNTWLLIYILLSSEGIEGAKEAFVIKSVR
jgi:hypothetical protein